MGLKWRRFYSDRHIVAVVGQFDIGFFFRASSESFFLNASVFFSQALISAILALARIVLGFFRNQ